jgi:ferredoxin
MEKSLIGNTFFITQERLACQLLLTGDVVIDVSEHID